PLPLPTFGSAEDLLGSSALGRATGVGAFGVVVAQVAFQVEAEAGLFGDQVAGEGWLPAFIQDGLLHAFHTAIGLWPAGADEAVGGREGGHGLAEDRRAELAGVVAHAPLQLPATGGQVGGHGAG